MADATYSVKVSSEDQERLKALVNESGLNQKDFFVQLLSIYELQKARENTPIMASDIDELETLTRRINSIFINVAERIETQQRDFTAQVEQVKEASAGTIELLQKRINEQETERQQANELTYTYLQEKEQAEQQANDLRSHIIELESALTDKQALIDELKNTMKTHIKISALLEQLESRTT